MASNNKKKKRSLWSNGVRNCHWCKIHFKSIQEATLEHIIRKCDLKKYKSISIQNNLTLACAFCNRSRHEENDPVKVMELSIKAQERMKRKYIVSGFLNPCLISYNLKSSLVFNKIICDLLKKTKQ